MDLINICLLLIVFYITVNIAGFLVEKIRIPKIYAALFLGVLFSDSVQIHNIVDQNWVNLLSQAGMFSLLFLLGYGLNIKSLLKQSHLIIKITIYVITSEVLVGMSILHFYFGVAWLLAAVIALSFSTVGEEALLPLLKEFKILKTDLGQTIMGVAILDDIVEISSFILLITFFSSFNTADIVTEAMPLIAIAIGVSFGNLKKHQEKIEKQVNFLALYIFGPVFFFYAGTEAQLSILLHNFWIILAFTLVIKATKLISSYLAAQKKLGFKKSIVLGLSLCIKFSTSIVILIILLNRNLITEELFTFLIGIKVIFKFVAPVLLAYLLSHWNPELSKSHKIAT